MDSQYGVIAIPENLWIIKREMSIPVHSRFLPTQSNHGALAILDWRGAAD
ncbi:MAG: hypothetical protein LBV49_12105 [Azonexus sp.]|nr:hypothetical protein [Azonexus sp.]